MIHFAGFLHVLEAAVLYFILRQSLWPLHAHVVFEFTFKCVDEGLMPFAEPSTCRDQSSSRLRLLDPLSSRNRFTMSMYQQQVPQHYGHPSYPPSPFQHQHQHQPAPYPPQPGPAYGYGYPSFDASSFRREYSTRLSELTMNSRPIIHNLSMMAQNFTRYSDIVADCLQAHIRRVSVLFSSFRLIKRMVGPAK